MHIWRCEIFELAFKYFTCRYHNDWGDLRHFARWWEVSSCKVIMSLSATLHVAVWHRKPYAGGRMDSCYWL